MCNPCCLIRDSLLVSTGYERNGICTKRLWIRVPFAMRKCLLSRVIRKAGTSYLRTAKIHTSLCIRAVQPRPSFSANEFLRVCTWCGQTTKALTRLRGCTGCSEPLLFADTVSDLCQLRKFQGNVRCLRLIKDIFSVS